MPSLKEEISRRRTFAIISHPDAGKTTLTEKFLLYGGAIQTAGSVKRPLPKNSCSMAVQLPRQAKLKAKKPKPQPPTGWKLKSSAEFP